MGTANTIQVGNKVASTSINSNSQAPPGETISAYTPGAMENWSKSKSFLGKLTYSLTDDIYVTAQLFRDKAYKQHIGGGHVNNNESVNAFGNTAIALMPIGGAEAGLAERGLTESAERIHGFRYVTESEVDAIKNTEYLRGGNPGETYFTKDVYKSASKAQQRLSLRSAPTHRVEFEILNNPKLELNGSKVEPLFGQPGKGSEFMSKGPIRVKFINSQPLKP